MLVSQTSDKLLEIQQFAHSLLQMQSVTFCQVISFLGKNTFCANGHAKIYQLYHVINSDMLNVYHSLILLFFFHLFLPAWCQLHRLPELQKSPVPLQFPLTDPVTSAYATPNHWAFYFQGSELPLSFN